MYRTKNNHPKNKRSYIFRWRLTKELSSNNCFACIVKQK